MIDLDRLLDALTEHEAEMTEPDAKPLFDEEALASVGPTLTAFSSRMVDEIEARGGGSLALAVAGFVQGFAVALRYVESDE